MNKPADAEKLSSKKQRGLGRGLDALLGDTGKASKKSKDSRSDNAEDMRGTQEIPIEFIRANPDQPRQIFNDDAISELADSIKARGVLQPILVRPLSKAVDGARFEIVAGERRWRAAQKAQLHKVPVLVRDLSDTQTAEIALIENVQRVDLNPLEEAEAYQHLCDTHKRTQQEVADAVGKSRSHIANILRLLDLPERVRRGLRENKISMGHARALLASTHVDADYLTILAKNLSVRQTEALVKNSKSTVKKVKPNQADPSKPAGHKDADTRALERNLAEALGLEVVIDHQKSGSGQVTVNYLNLDQLDEVCRRLMGSAV